MSTIQYIDPSGDLTLIVGPNEEARFRVSRSTLRLASPVWAAMVAGRFAEATCDELKLPADDPQALRLLLLASHLRIIHIASTVPLTTLGETAKLCDKYDLLSWATDHLRKWTVASFSNTYEKEDVDAFIETVTTNERITSCVAWMWIGWSLKKHQLFQQAYFLLFEEVQPSKLHDLPELPPGCADFLACHLKRSMDEALDVAYDLLESSQISRASACAARGACPDTSNHCNIVRSGQAARFFWETSLPMLRSQRPSPLDVSISLGAMEATANRLASGRHDMDFGGINHDTCYSEWGALESCLNHLVNEDGAGFWQKFVENFS